MPTTIEQLELEVQSSSTSAVAGIDALSASLSKLKNAVRGGVGLTSVANQVRNLDTALKSMDSSGADKIDKLASSLEKLKGLGSLKISSSIGNQLQNIGSAAASLTGVDFSAMEKLGTALQPLNNLNASGLKSIINALNKLPKLADTLDNMDMTKFTSQIQQLSTALAPLTNQLNAVTAAFNRLPTNIQRAITVTNRISQENNKAANSYMNLYAKIKMAMGVVRTGARVIASWITQSNQYIEDLNLFTASMGKYAEEAQNYAEAVSEALGIDPGEFMRNQGVFLLLFFIGWSIYRIFLFLLLWSYLWGYSTLCKSLCTLFLLLFFIGWSIYRIFLFLLLWSTLCFSRHILLPPYQKLKTCLCDRDLRSCMAVKELDCTLIKYMTFEIISSLRKILIESTSKLCDLHLS